ncbi:MAG: GLPGLI family protein [Psychroflexus halocasei]
MLQKISFCVFFIFFSLTNKSFSQDLIVEYQKSNLPAFLKIHDSISPDKKGQYLNLRKRISRNIGKFKYKLEIDSDNQTSHFSVIEKMSVNNQERFDNQLKGFLYGRFPHFTSLKKDSIFNDVNYRGQNYFIRLANPYYNWELKNETKTIDGFKCYLATSEFIEKDALFTFDNNKKEVLHAWYAPELPSGYGPSRFTGLPGMVLQAGNQYFEYSVTKIKESDVNVQLPSKPSITEKQKNSLLKKRYLGQ